MAARPTARDLTVLEAVGRLGPVSCIKIAEDTGMDRQLVYRTLYKCRCYDNGRHWIDNLKTNASDFNAPGEYVLTTTGQQALAAAQAAGMVGSLV